MSQHFSVSMSNSLGLAYDVRERFCELVVAFLVL
jgi:hypothetical protein